MSAPDVLEVRGLRAGYGRVPVVRDLDLRVGSGEVLALLGPNGAGKTTTLMAIAGFLGGTGGTVTVAGRILTGGAHRRCRDDLGIVLEGRSITGSLTVAQNLLLARVDPGELTALFPDLGRRMHVRAAQLSGGEQQMLALARAVGRRPKVLLIDELSFGLAPATCDRLFAAIRAAVAEQGISVLLVEQHIHYASAVADRAMFMAGGRTVLEMPAAQLDERGTELEELYLGRRTGEPA